MRFLGVAVVGLALDLWSKHWAFHTLHQGGRQVLVPGLLEWQIMLNDGALFGIGSGQTTLFLVASLCAVLLVVWMFVQSSPRRWFLHIALGGILAGALGNMHDRVFVRLVTPPERTVRGPVYLQKAGIEDGRQLLVEYPRHPRAIERRKPLDEPLEERGYVRDFIKIPTKLWGQRDLWPWVFNVADMLLVGGVAVLAIHLLREPRKHPAAAPAAS